MPGRTLFGQRSLAARGLAGGRTSYSNSGGSGTVSGGVTSPPPTTATMYTPNIYGSGWAMDSKSNLYIGGPNNSKLSMSFIASYSLAPASVRWEIRRGSGYSLGTGGTIRISIRADSAGVPTGGDLAYVDVGGKADNGGLNGGYTISNTFGSAYVLTAGTKYHIVFTNIDAAPTANYVSLNFTFLNNPPESNSIGTLQPAFTDDFHVTTTDPNGLTTGSTFFLTGYAVSHSPKLDIVYSDGSHDGSAYVQGSIADSGQYAVLDGANKRARERFTVSGGSRTVSTVYVRVGKQSGTGNLTIALKNSAGSTLATTTVAAASIPTATPGVDPMDNGAWVGGALSSSVVLTDGAQYDLELSAGASTQFSVAPMLYTDGSSVHMGSRAFREGAAQKTVDGSTWTEIVSGGPPYGQNLQFYFVVV